MRPGAGVWGLLIALALWGCQGKTTATLTAQEGPPGQPPPGTTQPPPQEEEEETQPPPPPFEAVAIHRAVEKVKYVANGLPVTEAELAQVTADPSTLGALVDGWLATPEGQAKLMAFFTNAFQQRITGNDALLDQLGGQRPRVNALLYANIRESFPRTALQMVAEGRPFNETTRTQQFMMTPALATFLAVLDARHVNDALRGTDRMNATFGVTQLLFQSTTPVPLAETFDPASANFMNFYVASIPNCPTSSTDPTPRTERIITRNLAVELLNVMSGGRVPDDQNRTGLANTECRSFTITPVLGETDYSTWRLVNVRRPAATEKPTAPFDLAALRNGTELVLNVPRLGFFSTVAFFGNWGTNDSNESRVAANQALIVAINHSIESDDTTIPLAEPALDAEHAAPGTVCYSCHRTLDPMRQIFRRTYTFGYHEQTDATQLATESVFSYGGVSRVTNTIEDYAATLAEHPLFAKAWTRKLCHYASSAACGEDDPEIARIAQAFEDSNFSFKVLAREVFSSKIVTGLDRSATLEQRGEVLSVARRDHLCGALTSRLKLSQDACMLTTTARRISVTFPEDGYSRGSPQPLTISDTSLFFRSGTENLCIQLAPRVVDATGSIYSSQRRAESIADMVHNLMGLPQGDPRAPAALQILTEHYDAAFAQTNRATDALRSTFVLACTSPSVTGIGL